MPNTYFGTILQETGSPLENPGVDGILGEIGRFFLYFSPDKPVFSFSGFAYSSLSAWQGGCVMDSLLESFSVYDSFSLCLNSNPIIEIGTNYWGNQTLKNRYQVRRFNC